MRKLQVERFFPVFPIVIANSTRRFNTPSEDGEEREEGEVFSTPPAPDSSLGELTCFVFFLVFLSLVFYGFWSSFDIIAPTHSPRP